MTSELHFFNIWIDFSDGTGEGFPCLPVKAKTTKQAFKRALLFIANLKIKGEPQRVRIKMNELRCVGTVANVDVEVEPVRVPTVIEVKGRCHPFYEFEQWVKARNQESIEDWKMLKKSTPETEGDSKQ